MVLKKTQRNELAKIISDSKLDASTLDSGSSRQLFYVRHIETGMEFNIKDNPDDTLVGNPYKVLTVPKNIVIEYPFPSGQDWARVVVGFREWVSVLLEEIELPDMWSQIQSRASFINNEADVPDEKFSSKEIEDLIKRVQIIEDQISKLNIPQEAKDEISAIVREAPEDAKSLKKKKFYDLLVGQMMGVSLKWALTTEHATSAWHALQGFTQFLLH